MSKKKYGSISTHPTFIMIFETLSVYATSLFWTIVTLNSSISIFYFWLKKHTLITIHATDQLPSLIAQWLSISSIVHWHLLGSYQYLALTLTWICMGTILFQKRSKGIILHSIILYTTILIFFRTYLLGLYIDHQGTLNEWLHTFLFKIGLYPYRLLFAAPLFYISFARILNYSPLQITLDFLKLFKKLLFLPIWLTYTLFSCILNKIKKKRLILQTTPEKVDQKATPKIKKKFFTSKRGYSLLDSFEVKKNNSKTNAEDQEKRATILEETLAFFGIHGHVERIEIGPVITLFEYAPDLGSKISKIIALEHDLALKLKAPSIRIIAPIPGKSVVGFEIANHHRQTVYFGNCINDPSIDLATYQIPLVLGSDIAGNSVVIDLPTTPHLLIAGSTGSGKSVGMHSIVASIVALHKPEMMKIIMIDPKRLEFSYYRDIPHLLFPLINEASKAVACLQWLVKEMEQRYITLAQKNVRNISDLHATEPNTKESMPYIVLLIDELADLMMVAGKEIEVELARLAQMARAAGIFLIVATQRPSVDVLTGLIKVNFPSRIAYRVTSKIDSRTILDQMGAEKLLGKGDMLLLHATKTDLQRIHGAFLSNKEIIHLANAARAYAQPSYVELPTASSLDTNSTESVDPLYEEIKDYVLTRDEISISMLQRHYRIGFNRSARIIDLLESEGIIGPAIGSKPRKVL